MADPDVIVGGCCGERPFVVWPGTAEDRPEAIGDPRFLSAVNRRMSPLYNSADVGSLTEALMGDWSNFFLGELGAAAALAGLLFVSVSVNQARILQLGRMADRGLESLIILLLVLIVASLPLIPGQSLRWLGLEVLAVGSVCLVVIVLLQRSYLRFLEPMYRSRSIQMVMLSRLAVTLIVAAGLTLLWRGASGMYLLPPGIILCFIAAGANAWVLLIEINR